MELGEIEGLSFEEAFAALEETVQQLERGNLTLDEAIALFERGQALARHCQARLDQAELRVKQLLPTETGEYEAVAFAEEGD